MPVVKSHLRKTQSGKTTRVKRHIRNPVKSIPVITNNPSVTGAAQYDPNSKMFNLIINDEDKDKSTTIMQAIPIQPEKVIVEENEEVDTIAINIKGEKPSQTIISEIPKLDFE